MRNLITNIETKTLQSASAADGNGAFFDVTGLSTVVLQVLITGAGTTKVNFEVSLDNMNWTAIKGTNILDTTKASSTITSGLFHFCVGALSKFRARISDTVGVVSVTVLGAGITTGANELSSDIASILGIIAKGQATMANSLPVTLASNEADPLVTALIAIKTATEIIDNVVSGNEAQVDVVTLPQAASVPFGVVVIAASATAQQLPSNVAKQGVFIVANELNDAANIVYLGFSNAVTNATYFKQLLPGEATPLLPVTNSNEIWVYCVFAGGTHSYNYAVF